MNFKNVILFCFLLITWQLNAQDLANLGHQKPIAISGTLALKLTGYRSNLENPYYPSSSYTLMGNPIIAIYGYAIPLSFLYTNQQMSVMGQPFNQFGLSPTYKQFTFNIGYRNVTYGKYAISGYQMYGLGVEMNKGNWKVGLAYGRLKKMLLIGLDSSGLPPYSYQRNALAGQVRYGNDKKFISISFLKGMDKSNSVPESVRQKANEQSAAQTLTTSLPTPASNLVFDVQGRLPIFTKRLTFTTESAISYFTNNINTNLGTDYPLKESIPFWHLMGNLSPLNATTQYYTATDNKLNYATKNGFNTYLQYTRIDPNYQSMGLYYTKGDLQNVLLGMGMPLLHKKLLLGGSIGRQNDNLNNKNVAKSIRWIGSGNASFSTGHFNISMNYYNFSSDQTPSVSRFADSLRITQTTNTLNCTPSYSFSTKNANHSFSLVMGLNTVLDLNNALVDTGQQRKLTTGTAGFNYNLLLTKKELNINYGLSFTNLTDHGSYGYKSVGMNAGVNKSLFSKKVNLCMNAGMYQTLQDSSSTVNHTVSLTGGYALTKKLHTDVILLYNDAPGVSAITNLPRGTKEFRTELNLSYTF